MKKVTYPIIYLLLFTAAVTLIVSCDGTETKEDSFDRGAMLRNYADQLIVPSFTELQSKVNTLQTLVNTFTATPSPGGLTALQEGWKEAYFSFQYASPYNFGPAGESGTRKALVQEIATFPVSSAKIDNAISTGEYNLNDFNRDARGFLAMEYLIFSLSDDNTAVLNSFESDARRQYLEDLTANLKTRIDAVVTEWATYKDEFISNDGTDVGSSTSLLYNEFVKSYESIKNFKVALPLGLRPGQITTEPTRVEAYYSGSSVEMLKAHYDAIEDIWYGKNRSGSNGIGFEEYLQNVEGGPALIGSTESQMGEIRGALEPLSDTPRFSDQLDSNPDPIEELHTALQQHIRYFKSDMSSLLGIAITYSSGDGD